MLHMLNIVSGSVADSWMQVRIRFF